MILEVFQCPTSRCIKIARVALAGIHFLDEGTPKRSRIESRLLGKRIQEHPRGIAVMGEVTGELSRMIMSSRRHFEALQSLGMGVFDILGVVNPMDAERSGVTEKLTENHSLQAIFQL